MEGKLHELTQKIYQEGLEKSRKESADILAKAQEQASQILADANRDATRTRARAEEEAEALRKNAISELQLAARQAQSTLRQEISRLVSSEILSTPIGQAFDDKKFFQSLIETAVGNWDPKLTENAGLELILPEKERKDLEQFIREKLPQSLDKGLVVRFDENMKDGFRIGPADGRYLISFTPDDFDRFFRQFLRPQITQLLFG